MTDIYTSGKYLEQNPTWHAEDAAWKAGSILKMMQKHKLTVRSVGEIGCGTGEILRELARSFSSETRFTGYEISPQAVALTKEQIDTRVQIKQENLFQNDNTFFDLLLCIDVLEHVEDYLGFLRQVQKKGTHKIFHIPLDLSVQSLLRVSPILKQRTNVGHLHYFTKEIALATLKDTGYEIMDYFYTGSAMDMPHKSLKSLFMRLPRKIAFRLNQDLAVRMLGGYSLLVLTR